jgi:probable phosphoglycerate mutase
MHPASSPREVWFIRHGESVANAGGRTTEAGIYPLTELGFRQAEELAATLAAGPVAPGFIVHSSYVRAVQTSEPTRRRFPHVPVEEWPVHEVQYLDPALCVGTTQEERSVFAAEYWKRSDPDFAAPNAESFADFIARIRTAIDRLAARTEQITFVFCHGRFMKALAWSVLHPYPHLTLAAMRGFYQFDLSHEVPNCSILPLYLHPGGRRSIGSLWIPDGVEPSSNPHAGI